MLRTRTATITAVVVLGSALLTACGSDGGSEAKTTSSPSAPATTSAGLTEAQLKGALLGAADYPAGYVADPDADTSSVDKTNCAALDKLFAETKDEPEAAAAFTKGELEPELIETLTTMSGDGKAEFAKGEAAFAACEKISLDATDPDAPELTLAPVSVAEFGDGVFAIKGTGAYQGTPISMVVAYSHVGNTLVEIAEQAIGTDASASTVEGLLKKAVAKVETARSEAKL